jgi:hypothetical protein
MENLRLYARTERVMNKGAFESFVPQSFSSPEMFPADAAEAENSRLTAHSGRSTRCAMTGRSRLWPVIKVVNSSRRWIGAFCRPHDPSCLGKICLLKILLISGIWSQWMYSIRDRCRMSLPEGEATGIVRTMECGVCVPPENPPAMAAIERLARSPVDRQRLAAAARAAAPLY